MIPPIEAVARSPVSVERPSGLSERAWFSTVSSRVSGGVVTVFAEENTADVIQHLRARNAGEVAVLGTLDSLLQLGEGWDSYGAPRISRGAVECTIGFLNLFSRYPRGTAVPTGKGGIQLEWHAGDVDVEIECLASGHAVLSAADSRTGRTEDRLVVPGHPAIDEWLRRLDG